MERVTHEIELIGGHVDKQGVRHARVVFGHRLTAQDIFNADQHPQGQNQTQYGDLILRAAIIEFGTLPMPVALKVLLDLDSVDRDDLLAGQAAFSVNSLGDARGEIGEDGRGCRLAFGFQSLPHKGETISYTQVRFGRRITGRDEVEADQLRLGDGVRRQAFLAGRQIAEISTADGSAKIEGPIEIELFAGNRNWQALDAADLLTIRGAAELWRQSFRFPRNAAAANPNDDGRHS